MAGYSGTPLARKLGIREGSRVLVVDPPPRLDDLLAPVPAGAVILRRAAGELDVALLFVVSRARLEERFAPLAHRLTPAGGLWVCWPKRASGVETDLTESGIREHGLAAGLVDNKVCAVDETWSGLRFVIRLADRKR